MTLKYLKQIEAENIKGRTTRQDVAALLEEVYRLRKKMANSSETCPECRCKFPGHLIGCVSSNERARKYQAKISSSGKFESELSKLDEELKPNTDALRDAERLTEADYAIRINAKNE